MSNFVKFAVVAAALFAGVNSITAVSAASAGTTASCQSGSFTSMGIWDCR